MSRRQYVPENSTPVMNRKHISRAQREAQMRQRVVIGVAIVVALVTLLLVGGTVYSVFFEPRQAMAQVGEEEITRRELYQRVNYERYRIFRVIEDTRAQAVEALADPSASFFLQFYEQQLGQLQQFYSQVGAQTLENMIEEEVIEREAAERDIAVSDEAVDEEIRRQMAQYEGALIEADVEATQEAAVAATATASQFTPTPSVTEEADAGIAATTSMTPTATPAPTPTPNILTEDEFDTTYTAFLNDLERYVGYSEADYRRIVRFELLREELGEVIGAEADVPTTEEQVHVAHILVETEEEAQEVLARLEAGEDFAELAAELSTDTATAQRGGELDPFGTGQMDPAFEEAAFALEEPGEISEPVETQFGYHIIRLIEPATEVELPEARLEQARQAAFVEWLNEQKAELSVNRYWDFDDIPRDPFIDEIREPLPTPAVTNTPVLDVEVEPEEDPAVDVEVEENPDVDIDVVEEEEAPTE